MTVLAQISDTHLMAPGMDDPRGPFRADCLRRCVADINNLDPLPDVVFFTGDLTQHADPEEYVLARDILSSLTVPFFITPGNRDYRDRMNEAFSLDRHSPPDADFLHYAAMVGDVRLVSVDTVHEEGGRPGNLCARRLALLDETLGEAPDVPTALFMHHPPFDVLTSSQPFQFIEREPVEKLTEILKAHTQIIRIFCGHAHRCYTTEVAQVKASTMPSVAVDLRLGDYPEAMQDQPLYQVHRFYPDIGFCSETRIAA